MKKIILLITLLNLFTIAYAQDSWITLTVPRSAILGAPVSNIKNGDINTNFGIKYDKNPKVDTTESANSVQEYNEQFKNFITKYFNREKVTIATTRAYKLKIRSLSQETIDKLQIGAKYVYEGIAADSVEFTLAAKKEFQADVSKAVKDIAGQITGKQATDIIEKITPFLDSIRYEKNDSVYYKVNIKNPNVYYKVKVIELKKNGNPCKCDWEQHCFLYFVDKINKDDKDFPRTIRLKHDFTGEYNSTLKRYPEFCGKDRTDIQYSLTAKKDSVDGLQLWVYQSNGDLDNPFIPILQVPFYDNKETGLREWRLNRTLLYRFYERKRIKRVFLEVSAKQVDENSLDIINWKEGTNSLGKNALTSLKYPEFKGRYVTK